MRTALASATFLTLLAVATRVGADALPACPPGQHTVMGRASSGHHGGGHCEPDAPTTASASASPSATASAAAPPPSAPRTAAPPSATTTASGSANKSGCATAPIDRTGSGLAALFGAALVFGAARARRGRL